MAGRSWATVSALLATTTLHNIHHYPIPIHCSSYQPSSWTNTSYYSSFNVSIMSVFFLSKQHKATVSCTKSRHPKSEQTPKTAQWSPSPPYNHTSWCWSFPRFPRSVSVLNICSSRCDALYDSLDMLLHASIPWVYKWSRTLNWAMYGDSWSRSIDNVQAASDINHKLSH